MDGLTIRRASLADLEVVLRFVLDDFIEREPLNVALGIRADECEQFYRYLVTRPLSSGKSLLLIDESNVSLVGVRLSYDIEWKAEVDELPDFPEYHRGRPIEQLLQNLEEDLFNRLPCTHNKLLYISIISVSPAYCRRGLCTKLLTEDEAELRADGIDGYVAESTAIASQKLFEKLGYVVAGEIFHADWKDERGERIFHCRDGTTSTQLNIKLF